MVFMIYLMLLSDAFRGKLSTCFPVEEDDGSLDDWLHLMEMLLCFDMWTRKGPFWKVKREATQTNRKEIAARKAINHMLSTIKRVAD